MAVSADKGNFITFHDLNCVYVAWDSLLFLERTVFKSSCGLWRPY